jgi:hypothetical protein
VHEDHRGQQHDQHDADRDDGEQQRVADAGEQVAVDARGVLVEEPGPVVERVAAGEAGFEAEQDHRDDRNAEDQSDDAEDDPAHEPRRLCAQTHGAEPGGPVDGAHFCHRDVRFCNTE